MFCEHMRMQEYVICILDLWNSCKLTIIASIGAWHHEEYELCISLCMDMRILAIIHA